MSYYFYLVLEEEKVLVDAGNYINEDKFLKDLEIYKKVINVAEEMGDIYIEETKVSDLSLLKLTGIIKAHQALRDLNNLSARRYALDLALNRKQIKIVGEEEIFLEGDKFQKEYEGYRLL